MDREEALPPAAHSQPASARYVVAPAPAAAHRDYLGGGGREPVLLAPPAARQHAGGRELLPPEPAAAAAYRASATYRSVGLARLVLVAASAMPITVVTHPVS